MNILLVYGTSEGHTASIAERVAESLRGAGHFVSVHPLKSISSAIKPENYDAVLVGASIHVGQFQKYVVEWVRDHSEGLAQKPNAFFFGCLTAHDKTEEARQEIKGYVEKFVAATGWQPDQVEPFAGALLFKQYNWLVRQLMKRIVKSKGVNIDPRENHIFTDWDAVDTFATDFAQVNPA